NDEQREAFERRRGIPGEVHEIRAGRHGQSGELGRRRLLGGPAQSGLVGVSGHSFIRMACGTISNVTGLYPSTSPSASIGSGRSASTVSDRFTRNSSM